MSAPEPPKLPAAHGGLGRDSKGGACPRVTSTELLGEGLALVIVHNGREYLLRVTQNGKLILTA
jgi:hemin uptake protein HemP